MTRRCGIACRTRAGARLTSYAKTTKVKAGSPAEKKDANESINEVIEEDEAGEADKDKDKEHQSYLESSGKIKMAGPRIAFIEGAYQI